MEKTSNCFGEIPEGYYFNETTKTYMECYETCKTCSTKKQGNKDNCKLCKDNYLLYPNTNCLNCKYLNKYVNYEQTGCIDTIPDGYYVNDTNLNTIDKCYEKCKTCSEKSANENDMKCLTCPEDKIKYNQSCYEIVNNFIKHFINPGDHNKLTSCYQLDHKYIIENTNECIDKPDKGYYVSNEITGLLSPCHKNCETCRSGAEMNSSEKLINMKCSTCKKILTNDDNHILSRFPIYDNSNIETMEDLIKFISEMSPRMAGANFRYFLERFINTYKPAAILGLECLPYFLFVVQSSLIGSFIVNQPIITDITKTKAIPEFNKYD
jgi:hypothetical protein